MKIQLLYLLSCVFLVCSCRSEIDNRVDKITFKEKTHFLKNIRFPKDEPFYNYSWSIPMNNDSEPKLEYVFGNKIYKSFSITGKEDKEIYLPTNLVSNTYSLFNLKGERYLFTLPGLLYKMIKDSFELQCDFSKNKTLKANKLELNANADYGNFVQIMNDSTIIFPVTSSISEFNLEAQFPLFATLNIRTKKVELLNYLSPEDFLEHNYFLFNNIFFLVRNNKLLINKQYDPKLEVFDLSKKKVIRSLNLRDSYQDDDIQRLSHANSADKSRYMIEAAHYGTFIYNPNKRHYYRLFYHALPTKNEKGEFTVFNDKRSSITVYDDKLEYLGTYLIPKKIKFVMGITPTQEGFILNSSIKKVNSGMSLTEIIYSE